MRNSKTVKLQCGLSVTVHEFRVAEVVSFLTALGNVVYGDAEVEKYIAANPADMLQRAGAVVHFQKAFWLLVSDKWLLKTHLANIIALVIEVNGAYFGKDDSKKKQPHPKRMKPKTAAEMAKSLKDSVEVLIREGHSEPYSYGFGLFVTACEFQEKLIKESKKNG